MMPSEILGAPSAMALVTFGAMICSAGCVASLIVITLLLERKLNVDVTDHRRRRLHERRMH